MGSQQNTNIISGSFQRAILLDSETYLEAGPYKVVMTCLKIGQCKLNIRSVNSAG